MTRSSRSPASYLFAFLAVGALPAALGLGACKDPAPSATSGGAASATAPQKEGKHDDKSGLKDPPAKEVASAAPSGSAPAKTAKKAEAPKKSDPKALSADEKKSLADYQKAMNDGRKATREKKTEDAVAAFDRALKAIPDDARAYGERGYARILAKDWKAGLADLDKAAALTNDKKLLGQIWFNYGLAAEGVGDAEKARAAFARSNAYNPTKAAKDKLAGKAACTATIDEAGDTSAETFDDWKAAYEDLRKHDEGYPAWSGDASMKALCGDAWKKGDVCLSQTPDTFLPTAAVYVQTSDGKVVRHELGMAGGRCGGAVEAKLVDRDGGVAHFQTRVEQGLTVYVGIDPKTNEIVDCKDGMECQSACADPSVSWVDTFVDEATGKVLLSVEREANDAGKDPLTVARAGKDVDVKGAGCDRKVTLATK
jgi:tetratricopeptide (TPR) repeat protein